jgi:ADP-ribose pyrophosphatase YjhB (NUDIX family)
MPPEAVRPEACVGAVVVRDDALLMIRRGHGPAGGTWSLPGGRIERGETAAEALVREVGEETGVDVMCGPFLGWAEIIDADHHVVVLDFEATAMSDYPPVAGDDAAEAAWVRLDRVVDLRLSPGLAEFLADHQVIDVIL